MHSQEPELPVDTSSEAPLPDDVASSIAAEAEFAPPPPGVELLAPSAALDASGPPADECRALAYLVWDAHGGADWHAVDIITRDGTVVGDGCTRWLQREARRDTIACARSVAAMMQAHPAAAAAVEEFISGPSECDSWHRLCHSEDVVVADGAPQPMTLQFATAQVRRMALDAEAHARRLMALDAEAQSDGSTISNLLGILVATHRLHLGSREAWAEAVYCGDGRLTDTDADGREMRALLASTGRRLLARGQASVSPHEQPDRADGFALVITTRGDGPASQDEHATPRQRALAAALALTGHSLAPPEGAATDAAGSSDGAAERPAVVAQAADGDVRDRSGRTVVLEIPRNDAAARAALQSVLQRAARIVHTAVFGEQVSTNGPGIPSAVAGTAAAGPRVSSSAARPPSAGGKRKQR